MAQRGLSTIIILSFVLSIGFLLTILSAVLYKNFLTLLVVATYVLTPLPNVICKRCANPDDFMESGSNAVLDFGRFITGFLATMGVCLPILLAHCLIITKPAAVMSLCGGVLVYGAVTAFQRFFQTEEEDF